MATTLTWASSGLAAKTGTTNAALITDIVAMVNAASPGADFSWQVASSNSGASPLYVVLKPKSGAAGRILLVLWSSAPAGNNATILDTSPTANALFAAYFPAGNVDTPSNLTSASGTILGNDTGAVKVGTAMVVSTIYAASVQPFYFDSAEGVFFGFQNPASAAMYGAAVGYVLIDNLDNAHAAVASPGVTSWAVLGTAAAFPWTTTVAPAGSAVIAVRTNYGSANRGYFQPFVPGAWATQAVGPTNMLLDTVSQQAWFVPLPLLSNTVKGEGFVLRLRQIGLGTATTAAFTPYSTTGPIVRARQACAATAGGAGYPWFLNFKL